MTGYLGSYFNTLMSLLRFIIIGATNTRDGELRLCSLVNEGGEGGGSCHDLLVLKPIGMRL